MEESLPIFTWAGSTSGFPAEQITAPVNVQQTLKRTQHNIYMNEEVAHYNYMNKTTGTYQDNANVHPNSLSTILLIHY